MSWISFNSDNEKGHRIAAFTTRYFTQNVSYTTTENCSGKDFYTTRNIYGTKYKKTIIVSSELGPTLKVNVKAEIYTSFTSFYT